MASFLAAVTWSSSVAAQAAPAPGAQAMPALASTAGVPSEPAASAEAEPRPGFDGRVLLAGALRTLGPTQTYAGGVHVAAGAQIRHLALHGEAGFEHGVTAFGLATNRFRIGPSIEAVVDRIRVGGGFGLVHTSFQRATRTDAVGTLGLDLGALVLVDLIRFEGGAFVAGVRGDLQILLGLQLGGSAQLGVRF